MKAIFQVKVISEADDDEFIYIDQNLYFPPSSVNMDFLRTSETPYTCPWKGECQYYEVGEGETWSEDTAWSYPEPLPSALHRVHQDFSGYIAFWRDVTVSD